MVPVAEQFLLFGSMIITGFVMGFFIDLYQMWRLTSGLKRPWTDILDFLIWIGFAAAVFLLLLRLNFGAVRYFIFIAIGVGISLYFVLFSRACRKVTVPALKVLSVIVSMLLHIIEIPVSVLKDILLVPIRIIYIPLGRILKIKKHPKK